MVTAASVYVAAADYRGKLADYQAYRAAAISEGLKRIAPIAVGVAVAALGAMEYIEIIGAIIAITLGYLSVNRERVNRTSPLIRSPARHRRRARHRQHARRAGGDQHAHPGHDRGRGRLLGVIGNDWINGEQALKLLLAYVASIVYMGTFYCARRDRRAPDPRSQSTGSSSALGIWLVVVLVLPQIGDTLDADNQMPGGLFAALTLDHDGEVTILTHFHGYEQVRTGIEASSLAKHYERFAFGMIDVKERYRGLSPRGAPTPQVDRSLLARRLRRRAGRSMRRTLRNQPTIPTEGTS